MRSRRGRAVDWCCCCHQSGTQAGAVRGGSVVSGRGGCWRHSRPTQFEGYLHCLVSFLAMPATRPCRSPYFLLTMFSAPWPGYARPLVPRRDLKCSARQELERMLVVPIGRPCWPLVRLLPLQRSLTAEHYPLGPLPAPVPWCLLLTPDGRCSRRRQSSPWGCWRRCLARNVLLCRGRGLLRSCCLCL